MPRYTVQFTVPGVYRIPVDAADPDEAREKAREAFDEDGPMRSPRLWEDQTVKPGDYVVFDADGREVED